MNQVRIWGPYPIPTCSSPFRLCGFAVLLNATEERSALYGFDDSPPFIFPLLLEYDPLMACVKNRDEEFPHKLNDLLHVDYFFFPDLF